VLRNGGLLGTAAVRAARWACLDAPELAARWLGLEGADAARGFGGFTTTGGRSLLAVPLPEFC